MCISLDQMKGCLLIQMEIRLDILVIFFKADIYGAQAVEIDKYTAQINKKVFDPFIFHFFLFCESYVEQGE